MTLAEEKQVQRKAGIAARRALAQETRAAANAALCARLAALPCFRQARTILLTQPLAARPIWPPWPRRPGAWAKRWPIPSAGKISA